MKDESADLDERREVFRPRVCTFAELSICTFTLQQPVSPLSILRYYGTFTGTFLTMFEAGHLARWVCEENDARPA